MYEAYYQLQASPFLLSPDPRFFYASRGHKRAMAYLIYGVQQGEGFIVITGEIGSGKTMLANALVRKLRSENVVVATLANTNLEADDALRAIASALGVRGGENKAALLGNIGDFLRSSHKQGKRVLLLVDEAQNLPESSLEELRMLSNFVHGNKPLLQTFLLGQPEFRATLLQGELDQLRQRVIASCHLGRLEEVEIEAYIVHRLTVAGWHEDPTFDQDAFSAIFKATRGIPRKINLLCDRLMLSGRLEEKHHFSGEDVAGVMNELKQEFAFADPDSISLGHGVS